MADTSAFPLQWPTGRKRTERYRREAARFDVTFARARDNVIHEVALLCGKYATPLTVISTNVALRRDGFPLASQRAPDDTGVAVYFTYKGRQMSFACDRWERIEHNMQAIAKTIEALRGIDRWGTGDMLEAAFTGFAALPPVESWWSILGVPAHAPTEEIRNAVRELRWKHHPDRGGDTSRMAKINAAWEAAAKERGL